MSTDPTTALQLKIIRETEHFKLLREAWNRLNKISHKGTLFSSWEWLFSWWETHWHFPCNKQLMLLGTGETDGGLVLTEYLDLIIAPGEESQVIAAFSEQLQHSDMDWHGATFPQLLEDSLLAKLFEVYSQTISRIIKADGFRTLIDLPETYKDYLMSLRKKKRNNITRMYTRLEKEQNFRIESVDTGLDTDRAIAELGELNRQRREQLEQPSAFHSLRFERFHRLVARRLRPLNQVQIRLLAIDDKTVAGLYSLIDGDTLHAYQSGFEAEMGHRYALLTMMITQEISACIDHPELKFFNFMYSDDENSYKLRYSAYTEPMYRVGFQRNDLRGNSYRLIHQQLKPRIKSVLGKAPA